MKRIISFLLALTTAISTVVFVSFAIPSGECLRIDDALGTTGYSAAGSAINSMVRETGGGTLILDILVESVNAPEGEHGEITAFSGGAPHNLMTLDLSAKKFTASTCDGWLTSSERTPVAENSYGITLGKWYEMAFRFDGDKASVYLNGVCMLSAEFEGAGSEYLILYPRFCTLLIDNVRLCDKDFDVTCGRGTVWACEDFDSLTAVDKSPVWYADPAGYSLYSGNMNGMNSVDTCVSIKDTTGVVGYASLQSYLNDTLKKHGGVTVSFDVLVEEFVSGKDASITAFTGGSPYNYTGYSFADGAFFIESSTSWITGDGSANTVLVQEPFSWETEKWYNLTFRIDGDSTSLYLDGKMMVSSSVDGAVPEYFILYPRFCDLLIDNVRVAEKGWDPVSEKGELWLTEDFAGEGSVSTSHIFFSDTYTMSDSGPLCEEPLSNDSILDVNGDGSADAADLQVLLRYVAGLSSASAYMCDVNGDDSVDSTDVMVLKRHIAGLSVDLTLVGDTEGDTIAGGMTDLLPHADIDLGDDMDTPDVPDNPTEPEVPEDTPPVIGETVDFSTTITTGWELANRSVYTARNFKTLYVMGCFGAPMNDKNKTRYTQNHSYNTSSDRVAMIMAASSDTFGFDCVCFIKGLLWGWRGDTSKTYGGASYTSNGVPDVSADGMIKKCYDVSTDFSDIEVGEVVWMSGHIGVYIGGGLAVECTPKWDNNVQITAVGNIGTVKGYNTRTWTSHGKLPYVTYSGITDSTVPEGGGNTETGYVTYTVVSGDTLSGIGARYGVSYQDIAALNGISAPYTIYVGQVLKIPQA